MPSTSNRPFARPRPHGDILSVHPKAVSNRRCLQNKRRAHLSNARADATFRTAQCRALKKLRTSDGWSAMFLQAQQLAERDVVRELKEARKVKKAGHEVEWMAKMATGQVEPDEVRGAQVGDGGLMETDDIGGTPSVAVDGAQAFISGEAAHQDDEWTTDTDDVEIVWDLSDQWRQRWPRGEASWTRGE